MTIAYIALRDRKEDWSINLTVDAVVEQLIIVMPETENRHVCHVCSSVSDTSVIAYNV